MMFGMPTFTLVHVALSLIGIFSGFVMIAGMLASKRLDGWTAIFLATTVATSVTGFFFPFHRFLPSHVLGIISLVLLPIAIYALYGKHLAGGWRRTFVITAVIAQYLDVFVLVVQSFQKVPALKVMAPTQSEPPFKVAQGAILVLFIVLGILSSIKFRPE